MKTEKGADHKVHVFVYGSLKRGLGNHHYLSEAGAEFCGFETLSGKFTMVSLGGFPAVCHDSTAPRRPMYGQLYAIEPEALIALDALEGHPRWYRREKLRTDQSETRAWIYLFPDGAAQRYDTVEDGMWRIRDDERAYWLGAGRTFPEAA